MRHSATFVIFFLAVMLTIPGLGAKEFYSRGEPREALVAQSILRGDSPILPKGYSDAVPSKPPTMHWLIALFSLTRDKVTPLTSRLPTALAAIVFALGFFLFLRKRVLPQTAFFTVVLLMTSVEWARAAGACRVDMILSVALVGAILLMYRWWERELTGMPVGAMLLLFAATLTKGPIALVLPGATIGLFLLSQKTPFNKILVKLFPVFLIPFIASCTWYVAAYQVGGQPFLDKVWSENVARFLGTMEDDPHRANIFYLYGTLCTGFLPWTILLLFCVKKLPWRYSEVKSQCLERWRSMGALQQLFFIASAVIIGFYSVPSSKRSVYLLPAYPFLSYAAVSLLSNCSNLKRFARAIILSVVALIGLILALAPVALLFADTVSSRSADLADLVGYKHAFLDSLSSDWPMLLIYYGSIGAAIVCAIRSPRAYSGLARGCVCFSLLLFAANCYLLTFFANQLSPRKFASRVSEVITVRDTIYAFEHEAYGVSFYTEHTVYSWTDSAKVGDYVLLFEKSLPALQETWGNRGAIEEILKSDQGIIKPGKKMMLVKLTAQAAESR